MLITSTTSVSKVQWSPVNTVNNGPKKLGCNNEVIVLTRVCLQEKIWSFLPGGQTKDILHAESIWEDRRRLCVQGKKKVAVIINNEGTVLSRGPC